MATAPGLIIPTSDGYVETPHDASFNNVAMDLTLTVTSTGPGVLAQLWDNDTQCAWKLELLESGFLLFTGSSDGTTGSTTELTSTKPLVLPLRAKKLRVTFDDNDFTTYVEDPEGNLAQYGDVESNSGSFDLFAADVPLQLGSSVEESATCIIHQFELLDAVDGTAVAGDDLSALSVGDTTFEDASENVWTLHDAYLNTITTGGFWAPVADREAINWPAVSAFNNDCIEQIIDDQSYTTYVPELTATTTDPDLGNNGEAFGAYQLLPGGFVVGWATFYFSGSGVDAGDGVYLVSVPKTIDDVYHKTSPFSGVGDLVGEGYLRGTVTVSQTLGVGIRFADPAEQLILLTEGDNDNREVRDDSPFDIEEGNRISISFCYKQSLVS